MRVAFVSLLALLAAPASADLYIKARTPKSQIDLFLNQCRATVPDASCVCLVKTLASTREGDFILDVMAAGFRLGQAPPNVKSQAALNALNRHGLKASEGKAILDHGKADILDPAIRACV